MPKRIVMRFILLFLTVSLFSLDFDVVVVGSSPFSLFEALYQHHSGKRVLILEESAECGGAWKSIYVCGIPHVDLGCHQIGQDAKLKAFLEEYAGCQIVAQDQPFLPFAPATSPNGFYFSKGCYELIDHLLQLIDATDIVLLTNTKLESVSLNLPEHTVFLHTPDHDYTASKVIATPMSSFVIEPSTSPQKLNKTSYYHLYLLIQDPTPPRFTYHTGVGSGTSRVMNLTHFVGLTDTGQHLIVLQTHSEASLATPQLHLDALKQHNLIDASAYLLKSETYIYQVGTLNQTLINQLKAQSLIEVTQTGHFQNLTSHISKWKQVLRPYNEIIKEN
jgi:hypothetical protein